MGTMHTVILTELQLRFLESLVRGFLDLPSDFDQSLISTEDIEYLHDTLAR